MKKIIYWRLKSNMHATFLFQPVIHSPLHSRVDSSLVPTGDTRCRQCTIIIYRCVYTLQLLNLESPKFPKYVLTGGRPISIQNHWDGVESLLHMFAPTHSTSYIIFLRTFPIYGIHIATLCQILSLSLSLSVSLSLSLSLSLPHYKLPYGSIIALSILCFSFIPHPYTCITV